MLAFPLAGLPDRGKAWIPDAAIPSYWLHPACSRWRCPPIRSRIRAGSTSRVATPTGKRVTITAIEAPQPHLATSTPRAAVSPPVLRAGPGHLPTARRPAPPGLRRYGVGIRGMARTSIVTMTAWAANPIGTTGRRCGAVASVPVNSCRSSRPLAETPNDVIDVLHAAVDDIDNRVLVVLFVGPLVELKHIGAHRVQSVIDDLHQGLYALAQG